MAIALSAGILIDRIVAWSLPVWCAAAIACGILAAGFFRRSRLGTACMLALLVCLGGARHHRFWFARPLDSIGRFASVEPLQLTLEGFVTDSVEILEAEVGPAIPSWMEVDRSRCRVRCQRLFDGERWRSVSGDVRLDVSGQLVTIRPGDRVRVLGTLSIPSPPANPGAPDYLLMLQSQGIDALLRANHPRSVEKIGALSGPWWTLQRLRDQVRRTCQKRLVANLSPQSRRLAASLLIGDRSGLTDELRTAFAESGSMHLLAISGLHVGILIWLVAVVLRLFNLPGRWSACTLITIVVLYAFFTNHRPPVLRAAFLACLSLGGALQLRRLDGMNLLAACTILLLLLNPSDLFDVGAQLSVLAVGSIVWISEVLRRRMEVAQTQGGLVPERSPWWESCRSKLLWLLEMYVIVAAIWLATVPRALATFHLVAPVGILLNAVLIPWTTLCLACGYFFMASVLLLPMIGAWLAIPFEGALLGLNAVVHWGQALPGGHAYLSAPPVWWLCGYYLLLLGAWQIVGNRVTARRCLKGLAVWLIAGGVFFFIGNRPHASGEMRWTFLSVGHGLCVVVEFPDDQVLLYDCGSMGDGRRAERAVETFLREQHRSHIDGAIISHADHDHYSGLFGLLEHSSIGRIWVPRSFLDFDQPGVSDLCALAAEKRVPIQTLQAGMTWQPEIGGRKVELEVLHPAAEFESQHDNANSAVMLMHYQGRCVLLTGDLERDGLQRLLQQSPISCDVMLAPHHGGKNANLPELYEWARPQVVIVSAGEKATPLAGVTTARVLDTFHSGAVTVKVSAGGDLTIEEFLHPDSKNPTPRTSGQQLRHRLQGLSGS